MKFKFYTFTILWLIFFTCAIYLRTSYPKYFSVCVTLSFASGE